MPLLSGSLSVTRFSVNPWTEAPDFGKAGFREILAGSEVRESVGFIPFEPGAEWEMAGGRCAFRVRYDKLVPDRTAVQERLAQLIRTELEETGAEFVTPPRRKHLRALAEEELIVRTTPRSEIVEAVLERDVLHVGTTKNNMLGRIQALLRLVGVVAEARAPWLDDDEPEPESAIVETYEPGWSVAGCRFLKRLLGDSEILVEPVNGYIKLATPEARVTITGGVLSDLRRYLERDCELLSAKLLCGEYSFRLEALSFRLAGLSLGPTAPGHWTERLDERIDRLNELWELLDRKYFEVRDGSLRRRSRPALRRPVSADASLRDDGVGSVASANEEALDETPTDNVVAFPE